MYRMKKHLVLRLNMLLVFLYAYLEPLVSSHKSFYGTRKKILIWASPKEKYCKPFDVMPAGNLLFKKFKCFYDNCYIYRVNESLRSVQDPTEYDVIMFNGKSVFRLQSEELPQMRAATQIYMFVQHDSAAKYPILSEYFNNFFNWTMTYRLDSDIPWPYFQIKTFENRTIGPNKTVSWLKPRQMMKLNKYFKRKLRKKSKTAWFTSNCHTIRTEKDDYINLLNERLVK